MKSKSCKVSRLHLSLMMITLLLLQACGGGDAPRPEPTTILVNAGPDIMLNEQLEYSLQGDARESGNAQANLTYQWSASPSLAIVQEDVSTGLASFTAPTVTSEQAYLLTLTVSNEEGVTGTDNVNLTIVPVNELPTALISVGQYEDYPLDSFPVLSDITFDGSDSSDPDPQTSAAAISAYLWQQTAGPDLLSNVAVNGETLTVQSPLIQEDTQASFILEVTDQEGAVNQQDITITLLAESKTIPSVTIGSPITVSSGELIALSGSAQSPARGAAPYSVRWSSDSALSPIIDDFNSLATFSIAPLVSEQTDVLFRLEVEDSYGNQREVTQTMTVLPPVQSLINDTGVMIDANNTELLSDYQAQFAGQDAHIGNDRVAQSGLLDKAGRGEVGFDFTRLNQNGDEIDQDTNDWRCVRDNTTGLIWENKTDDTTDLHYSNSTFTWYSDVDNGGFAGSLNMNSNSCNIDSQSCNTQSFINAVNAEGLCGYFDWRLPSHTELMSLVHLGKTQTPLVDSEYFPFMGQSSAATPSEFLWYWTSLPNVDGVNEMGSQSAWAIDFYSGVDNFIDKSSEFRVKLVRAGR